MTPKQRAEKIRELMEKQKIPSVLQLWKGSGVHYKTLYRLMSGKHGCNTGTIEKVAIRLNVSASLLI